MEHFRFEATVQRSAIGKGGAYVEFPGDVEKIFGQKGRIKVACTFDNVEYRGSLVRMGTECHVVGIRKEILARIGKGVGDRVQVDLAEDSLERRVVLHQALDRLLSANHDLGSRFHRLSYTRQKELNDSVASAKKEETRQRRLGQIVDELARQ